MPESESGGTSRRVDPDDGVLSLFGTADEHAPSVASPLMTADQRAVLRDLFRRAETLTARAQFETVHELTGQRISAVAELRARHAQILIDGLTKRLATPRPQRTAGSEWDDREEDTWIDKM